MGEYPAVQLHPLMHLFPDGLVQGSPSRRTADLHVWYSLDLFYTIIQKGPKQANGDQHLT